MIEYLCDYPFDLRKIEEKLNKDFSISTEEFFAEAVSEGLTNHKVEILFNKEKLENSNVRSVVKQVFSLIIYQYGKYKK